MDEEKRLSAVRVIGLMTLGAFSGFLNGIFGSGGGVPIVLVLWAIAKDVLEDKRQIFANVTAMILPISLASALVYFRMTPKGLEGGLGIGIAALVGGGIGAFLLGRLKLDAVKLIFAILLIVSGGIMIFG